jgi:hypothetical protein
MIASSNNCLLYEIQKRRTNVPAALFSIKISFSWFYHAKRGGKFVKPLPVRDFSPY